MIQMRRSIIITELKSILKYGKSWIIGCCVGKCIFELTGEVIPHYWYHNLWKQYDFVNKKHHPVFLVATWTDAQNIPIDIGHCPPPLVDLPMFVPCNWHTHIWCELSTTPTAIVHAWRGYIYKHKVWKCCRCFTEGTIAWHHCSLNLMLKVWKITHLCSRVLCGFLRHAQCSSIHRGG